MAESKLEKGSFSLPILESIIFDYCLRGHGKLGSSSNGRFFTASPTFGPEQMFEKPSEITSMINNDMLFYTNKFQLAIKLVRTHSKLFFPDNKSLPRGDMVWCMYCILHICHIISWYSFM